MTRRPRGAWHLLLLAAIGVAVIVAGVIELGSPSSSARTSREIVTAEPGVVQSTVSGTGNIEPGTDVDANFKASGTLNSVNVHVGQHVHRGQLLATLDPTSVQLAVNQAQLSLTAAQDQLTAVEDGSASASSGSSNNASTWVGPTTTEFVSETKTQPATTTQPPTPTQPTTRTQPTTSTQPTTTTTRPTTSTGTASAPARPSGTGTASTSAPPTNGGSTSTSTTPSPASIASAQAAVDSAEATLQNAQLALNETKLYAPASGTIASLASVSPGDPISAGGGSSSSSSSGSGSSSSSGSGSGSGSSATSAGSLGGSSTSSGSDGTSSSTTPFAEIVNTDSMTMTVAFSESDIDKVKVGQTATVSLDAVDGLQLAAHVSSIALLGTTSSSVVSYDATLTLDQNDARVKPGMSASASVITRQAQGVTLPNAAITGTGSLTTVNVLKNGKTTSTAVVVGLRGDNRTQIVSGLPADSQVVVTQTLPALGSSSSAGSSSSSGTLGATRGFGGLGAGGGAARLFGGGGLGGGGGGLGGGSGGAGAAGPGPGGGAGGG